MIKFYAVSFRKKGSSRLGQCITDRENQDSLIQINAEFSDKKFNTELPLRSLASLFCTFKIGLY